MFIIKKYRHPSNPYINFVKNQHRRLLLLVIATLNLISFPLAASPTALYRSDIFADIDQRAIYQDTVSEVGHKSETVLANNYHSTSLFLDSPGAGTYQRVAPLILDNYGTVHLKETGVQKKRRKVKFWNLPGKISRIFEENDELATQLEQTPLHEQYVIATKLAEYDPTQEHETSTATQDIASPEMLSNTRFVSKSANSILRRISRLSTIGGEISTTALLTKCNDNLSVIQERQKFIKHLVDSPELLHNLKDKLNLIKKTEPMFFSNYRPFKKERLKIIIKGDTIKKIFKKISRSKECERFATSVELKWYPLIVFVVSTLFTIENSVDLIKSFFNNGATLSNPGSRPFKIFRTLGKLCIPFFKNRVKKHAMNNSWKQFLSTENAQGPLTTQPSTTQVQITPPITTFAQRLWSSKADSIKKDFKDVFFEEKPSDSVSIKKSAIPSYDSWLDAQIKALNSQMNLVPKESYHVSKMATEDQAKHGKSSGVRHPSAQESADWRKYQTKGLIKTTYLEREQNKIYNKLGVLFFVVGIFAFFPKIEFELKALLSKYLDIKNLFNSVQAPVKTYAAAQKMYDLLAKDEQTSHLFLPIIQSPSDSWKNFIELTKGSTFSSDFNLFTLITKDIGAIFQAYTHLMRCREEMSSLIRFYGEIDAYVSMALLVKEHEDSTNTFGAITKFCFADFVPNSKTPVFVADDFWNPQLSPQEAVTNSISIGEKGLCKHMIITGAHGGGKTSTLVTMLSSILLAQTFGIAPAKSLTISPFSYIFENLLTESSADYSLSRFQGEAFKFVSTYHQVLTVAPHKLCAIIFDESLSGTSSGPAVEIIKKSSEALALMPNVFSAFSTHNKETCELEQETEGAFKNFKVEVVKMPDGKLYRPYKLIPGIGENITAYDVFFEAMQKQGIRNETLSQIIAQAQAAQEEKERKSTEQNVFTSPYFF